MRAWPTDLNNAYALSTIAPPDLAELYLCGSVSIIPAALNLLKTRDLVVPQMCTIITNDSNSIAKLGFQSEFWKDAYAGHGLPIDLVKELHCFSLRCDATSKINERVYMNKCDPILCILKNNGRWVRVLHCLHLLDDEEYLVIEDLSLIGYVKTTTH